MAWEESIMEDADDICLIWTRYNKFVVCVSPVAIFVDGQMVFIKWCFILIIWVISILEWQPSYDILIQVKDFLPFRPRQWFQKVIMYGGWQIWQAFMMQLYECVGMITHQLDWVLQVCAFSPWCTWTARWPIWLVFLLAVAFWGKQ